MSKSLLHMNSFVHCFFPECQQLAPYVWELPWLTGITLASVKIHPFGLSFLTNSGGNENLGRGHISINMTGYDWQEGWKISPAKMTKRTHVLFSRCPPSCKAPSGNSGFAESQTTASWGRSFGVGKVKDLWRSPTLNDNPDRSNAGVLSLIQTSLRLFGTLSFELTSWGNVQQCSVMFFVFSHHPRRKKTAIFLSLKICSTEVPLVLQ